MRSSRLRYRDDAARRRRLTLPQGDTHGAHGRRGAQGPHEAHEPEAVPHPEGRLPFETWKRFDKGLARELSIFFTGVLYSREVISQKQRELCAVAALTALHRPNEVRAHIHAALNVGATRQEVAEVIFQMATYGGMPVVVDALDIYAQVLARARRAVPGGGAGAVSQAALEAAVEAARAAGRVALKYYRGGFEVTIKPDDTPVTEADREAERVIVEILGRAFPEHGVLGEEFGSAGSRESRWIIDLIDGTKNFVRRVPLWATLIALEEHGEITVGVVHNPVTGDLYTARRGAGAFLNGERLQVSGEGSLSRAFLLHAGLGTVQPGRAVGGVPYASSTRPSGSGASGTTRATAWSPKARPRSTPSST